MIGMSSRARRRPPKTWHFYIQPHRHKWNKTTNILARVFLLMSFTTYLGKNPIFNALASSPPKAAPDIEGVTLQKACDKSRVVLSKEHGFVASGPEFSNYTQNSHCEWLIRPDIEKHNPAADRSKPGLNNANILSDSDTFNQTGNKHIDV